MVKWYISFPLHFYYKKLMMEPKDEGCKCIIETSITFTIVRCEMSFRLEKTGHGKMVYILPFTFLLQKKWWWNLRTKDVSVLLRQVLHFCYQRSNIIWKCLQSITMRFNNLTIIRLTDCKCISGVREYQWLLDEINWLDVSNSLACRVYLLMSQLVVTWCE
jgi:hypothetical protein